MSTATTDSDPRNLIINFLAPELTDEHLRELFGPFGRLTRVKVVYDRNTKRSCCYGFVKFELLESAQAAIQAMNGTVVYGRRLRVGMVCKS